MKVNNTAFAGGAYSVTVNGANVNVKATATKETSCLVAGTMIMLADGSQKAVENVVAGDKVMVFNHETGKYEAGTIWFNDHATDPARLRNIINLEFANGTTARIAYEHAYFDLDLMQYVFLREDNMHEFVGHRFVTSTYNGTELVQGETTLVKAYVTEEVVKVYGPITEYHFNFIADEMLSAPSFNFDARGMINIFEYDEDLRYNEEKMQADIETYGVFTYEDFSEYMTYEDYCKAPIQYFKVAIGKGNLTWEQIELTLQYLAVNAFAA